MQLYFIRKLEFPVGISADHVVAKNKTDSKNPMKLFGVIPDTKETCEIFYHYNSEKYDFGFFDYEKSKMFFEKFEKNNRIVSQQT